MRPLASRHHNAIATHKQPTTPRCLRRPRVRVRPALMMDHKSAHLCNYIPHEPLPWRLCACGAHSFLRGDTFAFIRIITVTQAPAEPKRNRRYNYRQRYVRSRSTEFMVRFCICHSFGSAVYYCQFYTVRFGANVIYFIFNCTLLGSGVRRASRVKSSLFTSKTVKFSNEYVMAHRSSPTGCRFHSIFHYATDKGE